MLVQKGHRIQLLPNNRQRSIFKQWAGAHRWAYNYGLERKIKSYESEGKSPGAYALMKEIVRLKRESETAWLKDVPKSVPRVALSHLDGAFNHFFRRIKSSSERPGFPKFKSRKRSKLVFHLEPETVKLDGKRVWIPKLGWVRMTKPLRFAGKLVATVAISECAGKWYASFTVEVETPDPIEKQDGIVGVDLGVKRLATLSDGTVFENPKALKRYERLLARAQRQLARKQKGSNRRKRARLRVARIQKRIADTRADATHKTTRHLADNFGLVVLEDLNASGMLKNHCLAKAVSDANFGEFRRQTDYKVRWSGGEVLVADRWFPSSKLCSICGCINDELNFADRMWVCECGAVHDRDPNAAINLQNWGLRHRAVRTVLGAEGKGGGLPMKRQEGGFGISPSPVD